MTVLHITGLDLSLTSSGIAHLYRGGHASCCSVGAPEKITNLDLPGRVDALGRLAARLRREIGKPDLAVIEGLDASNAYGATNERAYLWYEVVGWLVRSGVPVLVVVSSWLKIYATDRGTKVSKNEILAVVRQWWDVSNHDEADASVLAAIGADLAGWPVVPDLPNTHRRFFNKLSVPDGVRPEEDK